jgi:hypothetical protein
VGPHGEARGQQLWPQLHPIAPRGAVTGPRRQHGASQERVWAEPNRDYPGDTSLFTEAGNQRHETRLTPQDREAVLAALAGESPKLEELRAEARKYDGIAWEAYPGDLAEEAVALVNEAHAAGYALCAQDYLLAGQHVEPVIDYLEGLAADREGRVSDSPEYAGLAQRDLDAVERVIAMLRRAS